MGTPEPSSTTTGTPWTGRCRRRDTGLCLHISYHSLLVPPPQVLPPELHLISSSDPLPSKKGRREGLESSSYIPSGILPSNWARKHRDLIPGVIVAFFKELDVQALSKLRGECAPHGTHILVMLLTSGDEGVVAEKAAELCAGADLPPKSFFILFTSHPDRVHASVHR